MSHISGIRNLKELYTLKYQDNPDQFQPHSSFATAISQNGQIKGMNSAANSARSKFPIFIAQPQGKSKILTPNASIIRKKSPQSSKPTSRNNSISSRDNSPISSTVILNQIPPKQSYLHYQSPSQNSAFQQASTARNSQNINQIANSSGFTQKYTINNNVNLHNQSNAFNQSHIQQQQSHSAHQSPSTSPLNISHSQQFHNRSQSRDLSNNSNNININNVAISQINPKLVHNQSESFNMIPNSKSSNHAQISLYNLQLQQQQQQQQQKKEFIQLSQQQQQQQSYYHPQNNNQMQSQIQNGSINKGYSTASLQQNSSQSTTTPVHIYSRSNSRNRNEHSLEKNLSYLPPTHRDPSQMGSRSSSRHEHSIDRNSSFIPDSQRDKSASSIKAINARNPSSVLNSYRQIKQVKISISLLIQIQNHYFLKKTPPPQELIEKYKGAPFLNYAFLNNYSGNDPAPMSIVSKHQVPASEQQKDIEREDSSLTFFNQQIDQKEQSSFGNVTRNHFNFHYVIGKGGFGKVWKVDSKKSKKVYAMKEMSKSKIITKRSVNSVMSERQLLSELKNPFLVNMNFAFQDRDNLYLVMDLLTGGDLRFHIGKMRRFSETQTRFFIACMMMCLEYLHINNIIHRDIKPENLVIDELGYVRVTDLGIARVWKPENSQDTSGTPGYMAPEVMCRQNHGIAVDYFAVGVIGYEFMMGRRPYVGRSRKEIRDQILAKQVQIKKNEIPDGWSIEAADFINRMIQRKPMNRLGINGPEEVKSHPWLYNFPWQKLQNREIQSPFIPQSIEDNFDYRQQISLDDETSEDLNQQNAILLRRNSVQNLFAGYNFEAAPASPVRKTSQGSRTGSTATTRATKHTSSDQGQSALQQYLNGDQSMASQNLNQSRNITSNRIQFDD